VRDVGRHAYQRQLLNPRDLERARVGPRSPAAGLGDVMDAGAPSSSAVCCTGRGAAATDEGLFADLYLLTMACAYWQAGRTQPRAVFDLFFRGAPFGGSHAVVAGLDRVVEFLRDWRFSEDDLAYLRSLGTIRDSAFFDFLREQRFTGDVEAMPEGTVAFPHEPLLRVTAPLVEATGVETGLLNAVGFASAVATKATRIVRAAEGRAVVEFGARRAPSRDAALAAARAAVIGGCAGTSLVEAARRFGLTPSGTQAHAMMMMFGDLEGFRLYAQAFPDNLILLVDTYHVLESGLPNAIRVFRETISRLGRRPKTYGIRIDSGDLAWLSKRCRQELDRAGLADAVIVLTGDLDEHLIASLIREQGAMADLFGVGTKLATADGQTSLGNVYKLGAWESRPGQFQSVIKVSENRAKITNPGVKTVMRFCDGEGRAVVDEIRLADEPEPTLPREFFDPVDTWKRKTLSEGRAEALLRPLIRAGRLVGELPPVTRAAERCRAQVAAFSGEHLRLLNPHRYHVDLSPRLWQEKERLIRSHEAVQPGAQGGPPADRR
jgi:nicotinate phosphoribosyltransferase